ncbi:hypothetical protein AB0383_20585 [Amycolatopsis sp. NPDC051373]|uniref:hypothetical protein n=1 Tax=Amycolatopsis sp. NPDC051373 TaxID=3155801 RepID=UPI00344C806B
MASKVRDGLDNARSLGGQQGYREAGQAPVTLQVDARSGDILDVVTAAESQVQHSSQALNFTYGGNWPTLANQGRLAQVASNGLVRDVRTRFNTNLNTGIRDAAQDLGAQLLWIAEPDACATCLALSGEIVDIGDQFDVTATFAKKTINWAPEGGLIGPPRHPGCRCRTTLWFGQDGPRLSFADALRREAQRSILRGTRLPSESETVRLDAAGRLLHRIANKSSRPYAWQVPKSVQERATRAVKRGHFPTP